MNLPFLDLTAAYLELEAEIKVAVNRVLSSGWYILGPEVEAFETEFAEYCGANHCIGLGKMAKKLIMVKILISMQFLTIMYL